MGYRIAIHRYYLNSDYADRERYWTRLFFASALISGLAWGTSLSLLISSAFAPLLGEKRSGGTAGKVIDILAIFATLFGSAASLGLGALQIGSGLEIVAGIGTVGNGVLVAIITVLTVCFILSAVSGVAKGIQWLSNINMVLAIVLAVFVFVVGPTVFILDLVPTAVGSYFQDMAMMSARTDAAGGDDRGCRVTGPHGPDRQALFDREPDDVEDLLLVAR